MLRERRPLLRSTDRIYHHELKFYILTEQEWDAMQSSSARHAVTLVFFLVMALALLFNNGVQGADARKQADDPASAVETGKPADERDANVLHFGMHVSEMGNMDPHFAAGSQARALADMVFNGLLRYEPGNAPHIEPDLAENMPEFEMAGGSQIWTFHIRKGVMFHPGPQTDAYELTADDVVYSLRKSSDKKTCGYAGEYVGMSFKKTGPYTVQVILDHPLSPILFFPKFTNYAGGFIVSKRAVETMGLEYFSRHPVGTGPFMFGSHIPGEKLILEAHKDYFRGSPLLAGVEMHFVQDLKRREAGFVGGNLDVITVSGEPGWIERMEKVPGVVIETHGVGEVFTIYFNTAMAPLDDIRVRRAIAYALDREAFKKTTSPRLVRNAYAPVPVDFMPGGLTRAEVEKLQLTYATDIERARRLMAEAGYPNGFRLELISSTKRIYRRVYAVLKEQLAHIGIACRITVVSHANMHRAIRKEPRAIVIYAAWRPNADAYLTRFFHSDSIIVNGVKPDTNFAHYKKVDRLIEDARQEIDPLKQINLWKHAQIIILDDMAAYPIMYTIQGFARKNYVRYGHKLVSTMALYPQFTEKTRKVLIK
ncbi:MAG: ABC transporter substrate-binding protein [Deltaproteobacteria bacterium]|nr:ABC transporter substrate-binding protein [Deltaproteobacteria bacterium]